MKSGGDNRFIIRFLYRIGFWLLDNLPQIKMKIKKKELSLAPLQLLHQLILDSSFRLLVDFDFCHNKKEFPYLSFPIDRATNCGEGHCFCASIHIALYLRKIG